MAESANAAIKRWIKSKTSPELLCKKLKDLVKLQFLELKQSFFRGEGDFVIPEHIFSRNSLSESDLNRLYNKCLNGGLEYHPVINLQVKSIQKR